MFISYSHDDDHHKDRVLALADRLRVKGVTTQIDQYEDAPPAGWPQQMQQWIEESDFVVLVCSATYRRRFEGKEKPGVGKGATWEGKILCQLVHDGKLDGTRIVPVLFDGATEDHVPVVVAGYSRYRLHDEYEGLYRRLTGQPATPAPPIGDIEVLPPSPRPGIGREGDRDPHPPATDPAALARSVEVQRLGAMRRIVEGLSKARAVRELFGEGAWSESVTGGAKTIAKAILDTGSPAVLADGFHAIAKRVEADDALGAAEAAQLREIFELALHVVAGAVLSIRSYEQGLLAVGAEHPQTAEPRLACMDGKPVRWRPAAKGALPVPEAYLEIDSSEVPEYGMTAEERLDDISREDGDRLFDIAMQCYVEDERGALRFPTLTKRLKTLDRILHKRDRRRFAFARVTDDIKEREFLALMRSNLGSIRIIVPEVSEGEEDEDLDLLANLLELYRVLDRIEGDDE